MKKVSKLSKNISTFFVAPPLLDLGNVFAYTGSPIDPNGELPWDCDLWPVVDEDDDVDEEYVPARGPLGGVTPLLLVETPAGRVEATPTLFTGLKLVCPRWLQEIWPRMEAVLECPDTLGRPRTSDPVTWM